MENRESSHDSGYVEGYVDYSAELKNSEHSRQAETTKKQEMKRIAEALGSSGLQDELSESEDISKRNRDRSSDFLYTGNSGQIDVDLEEMTNWDIAKYKFKIFRNFCGKIVNNEKVQYAIVVCIFINAAMMGIATYDFIKDDPLAQDTFWYTDLIFLIIFTVELLLQAIYHGPRMLLDGWLVFDLIVVSLSWVAVGDSVPSACSSRRILDEETAALCKVTVPNAQVFRAFRIFRALRLVTRIKTMKDLIIGKQLCLCLGDVYFFLSDENQLIMLLAMKYIFPFHNLAAILAVMPRMLAIFLMLLLIFYIFAVMFTQLYSQAVWTVQTAPAPELVDQPIMFFRTLDQSMLTLFQLMTMDEWATVVRALQWDGYRLSWLFIILFIVISGFIMVNLIVAVICDAIGSLSEEDKEKLQGRYDSEGSTMNLGDQIDTVEDQIVDLTRSQARTLLTLEYLMEQLKIEKEKTQEGNDESKLANTNKEPPATDSIVMRNRLMGMGFARRKNFADTQTRQDDKTLQKAKADSFAKSARALEQKKMRKSGSNFSNPRLAQSVRNLREIRKQEEEGFRSEGFLAGGGPKSEEMVPISEKKNAEWK